MSLVPLTESLATLHALERQAVDILPVRAFDVALEVGQTDLHTPLRNLGHLATRFDGQPDTEWWSVLAQVDTSTPEGELVADAVMKGIKELDLVHEAVDQQRFDRPSTERIMRRENDLFGRLYDGELFRGAAKRSQVYFDALDLSGMPEARAARDRLNEMTAEAMDISGTQETFTGPNPQTISEIQRWFLEESSCKNLLASIEDDGKLYGPEDILAIMQRGIAEDPHLTEAGWTAYLIESKRTSVSTEAAVQGFEVPDGAKSLVPVEMRTTAGHELTHGRRSARAKQSGFGLGITGTPGYNEFEEPFCTMLGQGITGKYEPLRGTLLYQTVSLGMHALGTSMSRLKLLDYMTERRKLFVIDDTNKQRDLTGPELAKCADEALHDIVRRAVRGMHTKAYGAAHMSDLRYLYNLDNSWRMMDWIVKNDLLKTAMPWLLSGKFNPFHAIERKVASQYHPIPPELEIYLDEHFPEEPAAA